MVELLIHGELVTIETTGSNKKLKEEIQLRRDIPISCQLLSCGGQQLLDEAAPPSGCTILVTDFSPLRHKKDTTEIPKTEERGIMLKQLQDLISFMEAESKDGELPWVRSRDAQVLQVKSLNLYDLTEWIIKPATTVASCSYVELVAGEAAGQMPKWFISHAWAEPVSEFVQCVARHGQLRDLCETDAWWVCAYANNQHELGKDLSHDPRSSSFFRAMSLCEGLLLILDQQATPFRRIWCCFEQAVALTCKREKRMLLDIATCQKESAILITDGVTKSDLVEKAKTMYRNTRGYEDSVKAHREAHFPIPLILEALTVIDIKNASASQAIDKVRILNTICKAESLEGDPPATSEFYNEVDSELRSIFALAALPACAKGGLTKELESIAAVLQKDTVDRESLILNLTDMKQLTDDLLERLAPAFPPRLQELRFDLTRCEQVTDVGVKKVCQFIPKALHFLGWSLHGCKEITDVALTEIAIALPSQLLHLRLSFGLCPRITSAGLQKLGVFFETSKLKFLKLDFDACGRSPIGDDGVIAISKALPNTLEAFVFNLMGCHGVSDKSLEVISKQLRRWSSLRDLDLGCFACHDISDIGGMILAEELPLSTLERFALDLRGTSVTEKCIAAMISEKLVNIDWYFQLGDITKHIDSMDALREWQQQQALAGAAGSALRTCKKT